MSNHKTPVTDLEKDGLKAHGLGRYIGKPSQLVDVFRQGVAWALANAPHPAQQELVAGLHAVYFRNNWDGEGDLEYVLAHLSEKGEWTRHENGAPLIEFKGDEIIKTWPLTFEIATPQAQPQQEPVARVIDDGTPEGATEWIPFSNRVEPLKTGDLLYTSPPAQRTWVGLTEQERGKVYADWRWSDGRTSNLALCEHIEAKLKEKNT